MNNLVSKAKLFIKQIPAHWNTPPEGKHISYKEFSAYSFGGIGVNTINSIFGYVGLTASCLLVGSAYGIDPVHLAWMSTLVTVINLIKTPFVSMLIDNTNTKYGKFRPYLILTGIPAALLICLMAYIPNSINYTLKCVLLCTVYTLAMIFQSIYALAFTSLAQVLTPDSEERTSLLSVSQFIYSLGPSIVNIILPVLAGLVTGLILPYFYRFYGLHNDYDVLFDEAVRTPIFNVMIITTVISCLLAIVPVLFYNLNSKALEKIASDPEERKAISDGEKTE